MGWLLPSHLVLQKESFEGEDVLHLCAGLWASDVDNVSAKRDRQQTGCLHHCWYSQCARLAHKFFNTRAHTLKSDLLWFTKYISFHHITGVRCYLFGVQNDSSKKNIIEQKNIFEHHNTEQQKSAQRMLQVFINHWTHSQIFPIWAFSLDRKTCQIGTSPIL